MSLSTPIDATRKTLCEKSRHHFKTQNHIFRGEKMAKKKKEQDKPEVKFTEDEKSLIEKYLKRRKEMGNLLPLKFKEVSDKKGGLTYNVDYEEGQEELMAAQLSETTGAVYVDTMTTVLTQAANAIDNLGKSKAVQIQTVASQMLEFAPRDGIEGVLVAQMVSAHNNAMECLRRANADGQYFEAKTTYLNQSVKLMRTFTAQLEALNRYRGKGGQKVTVEHVHVNEGGQAIVGNVTKQGGGGKDNN